MAQDAARASVNVTLDPQLMARLAQRIGTQSYMTATRTLDLASRGLGVAELGPGGDMSLAGLLTAAQSEALSELQSCRFRPQPHVLLSVRLRANPLGDPGLCIVADAVRCAAPLTLHSLCLGSVGAGDTGVGALVEAIDGCSCVLHNLDLSANRLTAASMKAIAQLLASSRVELQELHLGHNGAADVGAAALGEGLMRNGTLARLTLSSNAIGPAGAAALAVGLEGHRSLRSLSLADNILEGAAGCEAARSLLLAPSCLERLWLGGNALGPAAADALVPAPPGHAQLTSLWLERAGVGGAGSRVAQLLAPTSVLCHLWLGGNGLSDDAALALARSLAGNSTLLKLWLEHNLITLAGARPLLAAAVNGGSLTQLTLEGNDLTADCCAELEAAAADSNVRLRVRREERLAEFHDAGSDRISERPPTGGEAVEGAAWPAEAPAPEPPMSPPATEPAAAPEAESKAGAEADPTSAPASDARAGGAEEAALEADSLEAAESAADMAASAAAPAADADAAQEADTAPAASEFDPPAELSGSAPAATPE